MIDTLANALGLGMHDPGFWMPLLAAALVLAVLVAGVVLDGFDIGVGCLLWRAPSAQRPRMLALLGPWRDANAFWLPLGLGLLVTAFPNAWGLIAGQVAVPLGVMVLGTLLRTVAFEWRLRAPLALQGRWVHGVALGSLLTALAHGYLLGQVVVGYQRDVAHVWFSAFMALCAVAAYGLLGATWLIMREAGALRLQAAQWGRGLVRWAAAGAAGTSVALAFSNAGVFLKWTGDEVWYTVLLLWGLMLLCFVFIEMRLQRMIMRSDRRAALPFLLAVLVLLAMLGGLAYSYFPYMVLDEMTLWDAAARPPALRLILSGVVVAMPVALIFNLWVYWGMFGLSRPPQPPPFPARPADDTPASGTEAPGISAPDASAPDASTVNELAAGVTPADPPPVKQASAG